MTELSFATTLPDQSKIDLASNATAHRHMRLLRLSLTDFRNYAALTWRPGARISVLFGPNGSGKTNLLEAVSLLVPGRACAAHAMPTCRGMAAPAAGRSPAVSPRRTARWISAPAAAPDGPADRRVFRLDGAAPRSQAEIAAHVAAVWLTPQMDRLFQEGTSGRRRFLDRLVWALEPGHAREVAAHDAAMAQRNRLLADRPGRSGAGLPGWRMRWRGTRWPPPRRAWRWWRG